MPLGADKKIAVLLIIAVLAAAVLIIHKPIPQDEAYHQFADQRTIGGIPNALNVLSNIPLLAVGAAGALLLAAWRIRSGANSLLEGYLLFFFGIACTGAGSFYYHLNPTNATLFWDRIPMTIAFMSFFSTVISERISRKAGSVLLIPLLALGLFSVLSWARADEAGAGDLRLYAFVQYVPIALIVAILLLYPAPKNYRVAVITLLAWYGLAKICEYLDQPIFGAGGIVSGHTLKHLFAAIGVFFIYRMVLGRKNEFLESRQDDKKST